MNDNTEKLKKLDNNKLIDVVKNYKQYGYDEDLRNNAIVILGERGISIEQLKLTGNFENKTYEYAKSVYDSFDKSSKLAFVFYGLLIVLKLTIPFIPSYLNVLISILVVTTWVLLILYFVFLIKSFFDQHEFFKLIGKDYIAGGAMVYLFLGAAIYIVMYFYFKKQMNDEMKLIN